MKFIRHYIFILFIITDIINSSFSTKIHKSPNNNIQTSTENKNEGKTTKTVEKQEKTKNPIKSKILIKRTKQEADNPEVLTLKGVTLDGTQSIDYYYPYFIRNHILKFDDDETQDTHLMDTDCKDSNCELCIPDHWDKCYKCKLGFLKLHGACFKYCPEGFQADIVRRRCYPQQSPSKNYFY